MLNLTERRRRKNPKNKKFTVWSEFTNLIFFDLQNRIQSSVTSVLFRVARLIPESDADDLIMKIEKYDGVENVNFLPHKRLLELSYNPNIIGIRDLMHRIEEDVFCSLSEFCLSHSVKFCLHFGAFFDMLCS
jgi:hypothetical protein